MVVSGVEGTFDHLKKLLLGSFQPYSIVSFGQVLGQLLKGVRRPTPVSHSGGTPTLIQPPPLSIQDTNRAASTGLRRSSNPYPVDWFRFSSELNPL
jgi:hypothetical protein